ncbi:MULTISPECIES: lipoyl domain-containing protein [Arthrobacter]|uniref:Lipoyl domain-containing protein n=2 Tax=Arthrobacter TaxID=1663 RepID=A0ABU9KLG6_9MICC|nr:lipoyl domain-containing protein [Arthrobacter sp. YJM1]MDP5227693.1 lipoyl domain-containing protein [Arthrobacter sp. YJM1]
MSAEVLFPQLSGDGGAAGVVATWYVGTGEPVTAGQLIADVAVEKVDAEVLAPASGILTQLVAEEAEAAEGSVIATIG